MLNILLHISNDVAHSKALSLEVSKHFSIQLSDSILSNCLSINSTKEVFVDWFYIEKLINTHPKKNLHFDFLEVDEINHLDRYIPSGIEYSFDKDAPTLNLPIVRYTEAVIDQRPVLFLDRDGIINVDHGYVYEFSKTEIYADITDVIIKANDLNIPVVITTNQAGVGRGYYSIEDVDKFHSDLSDYLLEKGARIDHIEICPFHESAGVPPWKRDSLLRKPNPGMHLQALAKISATISQSLMIGDKKSDNISLFGVTSFLLKGSYPIENLPNVSESRSQLCDQSVRYLNKMLDFS